MTTVKFRKSLSLEQLSVLGWLYSVRFCTSKQLVSLLGKFSHDTLKKKLRILEEQGFIGKHYTGLHKLAGKQAEYFLTPKGARQLPSEHIEEKGMKTLYKNKTVSKDFIQHCLNITDVILQLRAKYGTNVTILTKPYMARYTYFPSWLPDLFLSIREGDINTYYFADVWDETTPFFVSVRKMKSYATYIDGTDWPKQVGTSPGILAVCMNSIPQAKLQRQIERIEDESDTALRAQVLMAPVR